MSRSAIRDLQSAVPLLALLAVCRLASAATAEAPRAEGAAAQPLAVEKALEELKSDDWVLKWAAMSQLARWKAAEAVPPIKAVLAGKDHPWVRGRALVALAELLGEQVLDQAAASSKDATPELRAAAVEALGIVGSPRGEAAIAERLRDPVPLVRCQAIVAIARVQRVKAWDTVAPLLEDKDPLVVQHATRALVYINTAEAQGRMIALLGHADAGVRGEAAATLSQVRVPEAIPILLQHMASDGEAKVRVACEKALAAFDGPALMLPMLSALRGGERDQYLAALKVLSLRPSREACEGVAALIREPNEIYRDVLPDAFGLLTRIEADRYQDIFVLYATCPTPYVRVRAVEALGRCPKADHFRLLKPMFADKDHAVRVATLRVLRETTEGGPPEGLVTYFADTLQFPDRWTRRAVTDFLCERVVPADVPAAINILVPLLGGADKEDRTYTAKALARASDDASRGRIARAQGYVAHWTLIGPFPRDDRNKGMGPSYFPEHEVDFAKTYEGVAADPSAAFRVVDAACGGEKKKSLLLQPPTSSRVPEKIVATFRLELPEAPDLKLAASLGIQDGAAGTDGVQFEVHVDGNKVFEQKVLKPEAWQPAEVSLADFGGKKATIDLVVDPLATSKDDHAVFGEPRLVAGGQTLATLTELAESAPVRVVVPGAKGQLAWQPWKVNRIDGLVPLFDIFPPPIYDKVAYGVADITCAEEQKAQVWVKSDDGFVLWHNGTKVSERTSTGEQKADLTLREGVNRFLIKVTNQRDWWQFELRLTGPEGRAIDFRQAEH